MMEEEERCERCYRPKHPLALATLEYHGITIRVCLLCTAKVVSILARVPLSERIERLRTLRARWQWHYKQGEKRRRVS